MTVHVSAPGRTSPRVEETVGRNMKDGQRPDQGKDSLMRNLFVVTTILITVTGMGPATADIINVPGDQPTIQQAVDAAAPGDQIVIAAGNYIEQLVITKDLTLTGAGSGQTFLTSPPSLPHYWPPHYYSIVHIENTEAVHIEHLTIDGDGRVNGHTKYTAVAFFNGGGSVRHCEIINVTETPVSTEANGVGIYSMVTMTGDPLYLDLEDLAITNYQKGAVVVTGSRYVADLTNIVADAASLPTDSGQNGLEVGLRADMTVTNCVVSGHHISATGVTSCGFLSYFGGSINLVDCEFDANQTGLYLLDSGGLLTDCTIKGSDSIPSYHGITAVSFGSAQEGLPPGVAMPMPFTPAGDAVSDDKSWSLLSARDCRFVGAGQPSSRGIFVGTTTDNVEVNLSRCDFVDWDIGVETFQQVGSSITGTCRHTIFAGNTAYGFLSNTTEPFDARWNWWNDPTGPAGAGPGGGEFISENVLYDPWLEGNVICVAEPITINLADWDGTTYHEEFTVNYLGGGTGQLYGYSIDLSWDPAVITITESDVQVPDHGPFSAAPFFLVHETAPGNLRIDAALGGAHPGTPGDDLFKVSLAAVGTPEFAQSELNLTLNDLRDSNNNPLTGFLPDPGQVVVDLVAPSMTGVTISNLTLPHTDDFVKNGDEVTVSATVSDAGSGVDVITANLSGLGGGAATPPDSYVGDTATWTISGASTVPGDGTVTVFIGVTDALGNTTTDSDDITADNTPPAPVTGFSAEPGHNLNQLSWDDPAGLDLHLLDILVRSTVWGDYPLYQAPEPVYPVDHTAGAEAWTGTGSTATVVYAEDGSQRDIMYFQTFARDMAWNVGPADPGARDRATNYWLGDVAGDTQYGQDYNGVIDIVDVSHFGSTYGRNCADPDFKDECDIAPTEDNSSTGIPLPDCQVEFEDLMIIAINFANIQPPLPLQIAGSTEPRLVWSRHDERTWTLRLLEPCANLKGVRLSARLPEDVQAQVSMGDCLARQAAPVFLQNIAWHGLDAGLALLGRGAGIAGCGDLVRVTLSRAIDLGDLRIQARGLDNGAFDVALSSGPEPLPPRRFALAPNFPNPFNPATTIRFSLPTAGPVRLDVYTLDGRLLMTLIDDEMGAGYHEIAWHGRDNQGQPVASGTYFYRLEAGENSQTRKMVLMK